MGDSAWLRGGRQLKVTVVMVARWEGTGDLGDSQFTALRADVWVQRLNNEGVGTGNGSEEHGDGDGAENIQGLGEVVLKR